MDHSKLHEDLLKAFKEEKELIVEHLSLLDPLAVSLRKPIAARVWNSIVFVILESIIWLSILAVIAFSVLRDKVYPFYILARLRTKGAELGFSDRDMNNLYYVTLVFAVLIVLLLFIIARNLAALRKKNNILQLAGQTIKTVVGEQLKRKATIEAIDQRHFGILTPEVIPDLKATEVINPAY
jgi:hypothetical protein